MQKQVRSTPHARTLEQETEFDNDEDEQLAGNDFASKQLCQPTDPEDEPDEPLPFLDAAASELGSADPMDDATSGAPDDLPFRGELESQFGQSLSHVSAYLGRQDALDRLGAHAAARDGEIAFASGSPDKNTVAHEVTHILQEEGGAQAKSKEVSQQGDSSETEAVAVAARVAAGQPAGPISAGPSAAVHRKAKTSVLSPEGSQLKVGDKEYLVLPDEVYEAKKAGLPSETTLSETEYGNRKRAHVKAIGDKLIADLCAIDTKVANKPLYDLHNYDKDIVLLLDAAGPEGRRSAWKYLRDNAMTFKNVDLAQKLAKLTDPISELQGYLTADTIQPVILNAIRTWAVVNGEPHCLRARGMGDVQVQLKQGLGDLAPVGLLYLMKAGSMEPDTASEKITKALAFESSEDFLTAWEELKATNPTLAQQKLTEAVFLEDVRTRVGEANKKVLSDLANWSPPTKEPDPQGPAGPLTPAQLNAQVNTTQYTALAKATATKLATSIGMALRGDLDGKIFWAQSMAEVRKLRTEIARISTGDVSTKAGRATAAVAIDEGMALLRMALGPLGSMLAVAAKSDPKTANTVVGLIGGELHDVRKDILRQLDWDKLSESQQRKADEICKTMADRLQGYWLNADTEKVHGALNGFNTAVFYLVTYENSGAGLVKGDSDADWAIAQRRRQVHLMLDKSFAARTGLGLQALVTMTGSSQTASMYSRAREDRELADEVYTAGLTAVDERKLASLFTEFNGKLKPIFDAKDMNHPGLSIQRKSGSSWDLGLVPKRGWLLTQLKHLKQRTRKALKPAHNDGKTLVLWEKKTTAAMESFESQFEAKVGSLRRALRDGDGKGKDEQAGLTLLNEKADGTQALFENALGKVSGDATKAHTFLLGFQSNIGKLATSMYGELKGAILKREDPARNTGNPYEAMARNIQNLAGTRSMRADGAVSDSKILNYCRRFQGLQSQYSAQVPEADPSDAKRYLTTAFAPLGGDMRPLIAAGLGRKNGSEALHMLGMHYSDFVSADADAAESAQAQAAIDDPSAKRQEEFSDFCDRVGWRAAQISGALSKLEGDVGDLDRIKGFNAVLGSLQEMIRRAQIATEGVAMLNRLWTEKLGIKLENDLGYHLVGWERAAVQTQGLKIGALPAPRDLSKGKDDLYVVQSVKDMNPEGADTFRSDYHIKAHSVHPDFSKSEALSRARTLYRHAGELPGSHKKLMEAVGGSDGYPEEARVVLEVFTKTYGFDLRYRLRQTFPDAPDQVERYTAIAQTAGGLNLGGEAVERSYFGDKTTLMRVALQASPKERQALLANHAKLGEIRAQLGTKDYAHFYRTLNGHTDVYDIVRNQTGKQATEHIKAYFDGRRHHWKGDPELRKQAGRDPKKLAALVEAKIRAEARKAYADPAFQKAVADKHGGKERGFNIRAAVLGGGTASGLDQAMSNTWGSGTDEDGLKSETRQLTDEERKRARNDPHYQARIASDLLEGGNDDKDARHVFADLYSDQGDQGQSQLHAAEKKGEHVYDFNDTSKVVDQGKALEAVHGMSISELTKLQSDPAKFLAFANKLDDKHLARLRKYIAETNEIRDTHQASGDQVAADRNSKLLIARYVARFVAASPSNKKMFLVASQCFNETGLIPSEEKGKKPLETFGPDEKKEVFHQILGKVDMNKAFWATKNALIMGIDPANGYLDVAFEDKDSQEHILKAIDNASMTTILTKWSNVLLPGPEGADASLKTKFEAYIGAQADFRAEPTDQMDEAYQLAKHRFRDHRLDLSEPFLGNLKNGWGDTHLQKWNPMGERVADKPSKKRLLEMKEHARKRIWSLSVDEVAPKVGLVAPAALGEDATEDEKKKHQGQQRDYQNQRAMLISEDRTARSELEHRRDVHDFNRGEGRGSGAEDEGRLVDLNFMVLKGELGQSIGDDGEIDENERTKIKSRSEDFDRSVKEYKEAKAKLAALLSFIIKAVIIAIATAVTGGAAGVLATMLLSAGGVVIDNLIQEEILGDNEHSWENLSTDIFKAVATDLFTFGVGKAVKGAAAGLKVSGKLAKVTAFEEKLRGGATKTFKGMLLDTAYESTKTVVTAPLGTLSDWAIDLAVSDEDKWGRHDWGEYASSSLGTRWGQMTDGFKGDLIGILASNVVGYGRNKLTGKTESLLQGIEIPAGAVEKHRSVLKAAGKYIKTDALGDGIEALSATALETVAMSVVNDTGLSYDDVYWVLAKAGGKTLNGVAGAAADARNDNLTTQAVDKHAGHEFDDPALAAHYRHYVSKATVGLSLKKKPEPPDVWLGRYQDKVLKNLPPDHNHPYRKWVLADPRKTLARSTLGEAEFTKQHGEGLKKAANLRNRAKEKLSPGSEQIWYSVMLEDTGLLLKLGKGATNPYNLDDDASVAAYRKALENTMRQTVISRASSLSDTWSEGKQKAWFAQVNSWSSSDLEGLPPVSSAASMAGTLQRASKWGLEFDQTNPGAGVGGSRTYQGAAPSVDVPRAPQSPTTQDKPATDSVEKPGAKGAKPPPIPQTGLRGQEAHLSDGKWTVTHQTGDVFALERIGADGKKERRRAHILHLGDPKYSAQNKHLFPDGEIPEHTVADVGGDPHNSRVAYERMIAADPYREAGIYVNSETGMHIVVQGEKSVVAVGENEAPGPAGVDQRFKEILPKASKEKGAWTLKCHYHPNREGTKHATHLDRFASDGLGDMHTVWYASKVTGEPGRSSIDYNMPWGRTRTVFGYEPSTGAFWIDMPEGMDPTTKKEVRRKVEFRNIEEYHVFLSLNGGEYRKPPADIVADSNNTSAKPSAQPRRNTKEILSDDHPSKTAEWKTFDPEQRTYVLEYLAIHATTELSFTKIARRHTQGYRIVDGKDGRHAENALPRGEKATPLPGTESTTSWSKVSSKEGKQHGADASRFAGMRADNLEIARQARATGDDQKADLYYDMARKTSELMGTSSARAYMATDKKYAGFQEKKMWVEGANTLDHIYIKGDDVVIVEAKGGSSQLGWRKNADSTKMVQQGTPEYLEAVVNQMKKRAAKDGQPEDEEAFRQVLAAYNSGKLKYLVVTQTADENGNLADIDSKEYKMP